MGFCSARLVIVLIAFSMTAFAETNKVTMRDLLQRQKTVVRQARESGTPDSPATIIKYVKVPVYTEAPEGATDFRKHEEETHRYDTPFESQKTELASKIVDLVPKGKTLKCKLLTAVDSSTTTLITAEILEDYAKVELKGKRIMGKVTKAEGERLYLTFTDLETTPINAQALSLQGELGLKADTIDRKTESIIIKEVGTLLYGLGKVAINAQTAGLGAGVMERVSGADESFKNIEVKPVLCLKNQQIFLIRFEDNLKIERNWLL